MALLPLMGQSLTHLLVHAIFSTKDRRPLLRSEEIREIFKRHRVAFDETLCLGLNHPRVGRPFRARRLMSFLPGLKHLGYSVRPLRGHRKMSKLQGLQSLQPSVESSETPSDSQHPSKVTR